MLEVGQAGPILVQIQASYRTEIVLVRLQGQGYALLTLRYPMSELSLVPEFSEIMVCLRSHTLGEKMHKRVSFKIEPQHYL